MSEKEEEFAVYSFDPGTTNFSVSKIAITVDLTDKQKYYGVRLVWSEILQVRYDGPKKKEFKRSDDDMVRALCDEFMTGKVSKICTEYEKELAKRPNKKLFLLVEPQLDQILGGGSKGKNGFFKDPMLFVFYHAVNVFFYSRYGKSVHFISWRGHDKSGLADVHGDDRKEQTIPIACKFLRDEGFEESALYIESLKKPKPAQDVADSYNQGRNFILNFISQLGFKIKTDNNLDCSMRLTDKLMNMDVVSNKLVSYYSELGSVLIGNNAPQIDDLCDNKFEDYDEDQKHHHQKKKKMVSADKLEETSEYQKYDLDKMKLPDKTTISTTKTEKKEPTRTVSEKNKNGKSGKNATKKKKQVRTEYSDISFNKISSFIPAQDFLVEKKVPPSQKKLRISLPPGEDTPPKKRRKTSRQKESKSEDDTEDSFSCYISGSSDNPWTKSKKT